MSHTISSSYLYPLAEQPSNPPLPRNQQGFSPIFSATLADLITKEASTQTYFTIRYLADPPLVADAYRAYAYFRWVDDIVDEELMSKENRLDFLARQQEIISRCYRGEWPEGLRSEEQIIVDLIHNDQEESSGLRTYIHQMMAVMVFDAERRDRFISEEEWNEYTHYLAVAVTEALHYFIGHDDASPQGHTRYLAVTGAHITHMLRDMIEDTAAGYYNIPQGFLLAHGLAPTDVNHDAYRSWVRGQVKLARNYFSIGKSYMAQVENLRCRLAGYAYIARFEVVLDIIEKDGYRLRASYPERKSKRSRLKVGLIALAQTFVSSLPGKRAPSTESVISVEMI